MYDVPSIFLVSGVFMKREEHVLKGIPESGGIAIGTLHVCHSKDPEVVEFAIDANQVDTEIDRFQNALSSSKQDLHSLQLSLQETGVNDAVSVIDSHIQMLDDPMLRTTVEKKIRSLLQNTESVFQTVVGEFETQFSAFEEAYFQQRIFDIRDVSKRVLKHLHETDDEELLPSGAVLYSKELVPSETAAGISRQAIAFVSHQGGGTSHAALIARAFGVPFVSDIEECEELLADNVTLIVDGYEGVVILNPTETTLQKYKSMQCAYEACADSVARSVHTKDGTPISVLANISSCEFHEPLACQSADGVGLFRTEFMAFGKEISSLSGEMQQREYEKIYDLFDPRPIVFRVFDFGSDKKAPHLHKQVDEQNPALGLRAIRYLLSEEVFFRTQLSAMLKASAHKTLRLLFPLIADPSEMVTVKEITMEELEKIPGEMRPQSILYGAMIELPSAVFLCEEIADEVDFLSIGSNDLIQYTLGIDRGNKNVNSLYGAVHPALLRSLDMIVKAGAKKGIPVSLCGELASEPRYTQLLIGLGITYFSCSPRLVCTIKQEVEKCNYAEARELASKAIRLSSAPQLEELLSQ